MIGPNGCGKSSVFDGMLYYTHRFQKIGNKGNKDYRYHSMHQSPNYNYENVEIEFDKGEYRNLYREKQKQGQRNTFFSFRSPYRYNSNLKVTQSRATSEIRLNNYGASFSSDLDEKMEENYRRLYIKYNRYLNETNSRPSEVKEKIIGDLNDALRSCLDLEVTSIGNIESSEGTLFFNKADHSTDFEFNVLSSGEKEVVDILLDLYMRQDEYTDTIFIIDEPELHISTSIQRKLLTEINKLIGENCQIWIATHSIGFMRALQEDFKDETQIIYFPPGVDWASTSQVLSPVTQTRSQWQEVFETALDDLSGLVSPKRIIYCEGKDNPGNNGQEKEFDAKVFNNVFSEQYNDTLFVSSGGNTELDQRSDIAIAILAKVFNNVEILVLKDRDMSSGKMNTESDRLIYLKNNQDNHRVLKRWEIENYLYDKEVLKSYCASNDLDFDEAEYDKFVTNIEDQNLKDETGRIRNYCGINTSISPERFKINLSEHVKPDMSVYSELEKSIFDRQ